MIFNIFPVISIRDNSVVVTSTRPVSSLLWDVSCKINDYGVFERDRPNRTDTCLEFWANPGYSIENVLALVIPAVYIAAVWDNAETFRERIERFWNVSIDGHIARIPDTLTLPDGHAADEAACNYVMTTWLLHCAWSAAKGNSYDDLSRLGLNKSFTSNRIEFAKSAVRRLRFMNPQETFIGAETINHYINEIETTVPLLEQDHYRLCKYQEQIETVKSKVRESRDLLELSIETSDTASNDLFIQWQEYMAQLKHAISECRSIIDLFDEDSCAPHIARIKEITPDK